MPKQMDLTELKNCRYWREAQARRVVEAWRASGLPLETFARRYGLHAQRIRRWLKILHLDAPDPVALVPVRIVEREQRAAAPAMELVLAGGRIVRVPPDFDAAALVRLVRALEASC